MLNARMQWLFKGVFHRRCSCAHARMHSHHLGGCDTRAVCGGLGPCHHVFPDPGFYLNMLGPELFAAVTNKPPAAVRTWLRIEVTGESNVLQAVRLWGPPGCSACQSQYCLSCNHLRVAVERHACHSGVILSNVNVYNWAWMCIMPARMGMSLCACVIFNRVAKASSTALVRWC